MPVQLVGEQIEVPFVEVSAVDTAVVRVADAIQRLGIDYGQRLQRTAWTKVKIAVFAPIPNAIIKMMVRAKPGDFTSWRIGRRMLATGYSLKLYSISITVRGRTKPRRFIWLVGDRGSRLSVYGSNVRPGH